MLCGNCDQDMLKAQTCVYVPVEIGEEKLDPIRFGDEEGLGPLDPSERCGDCFVQVGGYHHPGCDMERCPNCGGQLISCGCLDEEDEEDG